MEAGSAGGMENAPADGATSSGLDICAPDFNGPAVAVVGAPPMDCGSPCDIKEGTSVTVCATLALENVEAADVSDSAPKAKRGRRSKNLVDFGELDEALSHELRQGYRILNELMASGLKTYNEPFLDYPVDESEDFVYRLKISCPMWLNKMREKFENKEYQSITEFVKDFRLMLENCYRFNGFEHYIAKKAQQLETLLEKKLTLLSGEIQAKTTFAATSGHSASRTSGTPQQGANENADGDGGKLPTSARGRVRRPPASPAMCAGKSAGSDAAYTLLQRQLLDEYNEKEQDARRRQQEHRRREQEQLTQELQQWEHSLVDEQTRKEMSSMWELPHIGHFLSLCRVALNIPEVAQHELERILLMPAESSLLSSLMTSLLSTPQQRLRLRNRAPMPFTVWEAKLRTRLDAWYLLADEMVACGSSADVLLGIDARFFGIVGCRNPLASKSFADLTFLQRVWVIKALCEHCLHTQDTLREAIELLPAEEARESVLGMDSQGRSYLHFPQSHGTDVRVYRLAANTTRGLDRLPNEKPSCKTKPASKGTKRKAKMTDELRENGCVLKSRRAGVQRLASSRSVKADAASSSSAAAAPVQMARNLEPADVSVRRSARNMSRGLKVENNTCEAISDCVECQASSAKIQAAHCDSAVSAGHPTKIKARRSETLESSDPVADRIATSLSGDSAGSRSSCDASPRAATLSESLTSSTAGDLATENRRSPLINAGLPSTTSSEVHVDAPKQEEDADNLVTHVNEFEAFETVARSVSELRSLIAKFYDDGTTTTARRERDRAQERSRALAVDKGSSELQLRENLQCMLKKIEPFEARFENNRRRIIEKLRREKTAYKPLSTLASSEALIEWNSDDAEVANVEPSETAGAEDNGASANKDGDVPATVRSSNKRRIEQSQGVQPQSLPIAPNDSESWDVSSFGRPRKKRVIPNNVEDSGMPRKRTPAVTSSDIEDAVAAASPEISPTACKSERSSPAGVAAAVCVPSTCGDTASTFTRNAEETTSNNGRAVAAAAVPSASQTVVSESLTYTNVRLSGQPYMVATRELPILLRDVQDYNNRMRCGAKANSSASRAAASAATAQLWEKRYVRTTGSPSLLSTLLVAFGGSDNSKRDNPTSHTPVNGMQTGAPGMTSTASNVMTLATLLAAGASQPSTVYAISARADDKVTTSAAHKNAIPQQAFSALDCVAQRPVSSAAGNEQIPNSSAVITTLDAPADANNIGCESGHKSAAAPALHRMASAVQQQQSPSQTASSSASEILPGHAASVAVQAKCDRSLLNQRTSHQQQNVPMLVTASVTPSSALTLAPLATTSMGVLSPISSQASLRPAFLQAATRPTFSMQARVTPTSVRAPIRSLTVQTGTSNPSAVAILQGIGGLVPASVRSNAPLILCQPPTNAVIRVANGAVMPAILQTATSAASSSPMVLTTPIQSAASQSLLLLQSPGQSATAGNVSLPVFLQLSNSAGQLLG